MNSRSYHDWESDFKRRQRKNPEKYEMETSYETK